MRQLRLWGAMGFLGGWLLLFACNAQPAASNLICQPSQLVRCNDCDKPAGDPRVYRGWIQCSANGTEFVGTCTDCEPDGTDDDGSSPVTDTGSPPFDANGGKDTSSGNDEAGHDSGLTEPTSLNIQGSLDQLGTIDTETDTDAGTVTTKLSGTASSVTYDTLPTEAPDLGSAQSLMLTPGLGACAGSMSFSLSLSSATFSFQGVDTSPATDCQDYASGLQSSGVVAVFQTVPYPGSESVATQVSLSLSIP